MARRKFIPEQTFPYHVYNRTLDRSFYGLNMDQVWGIFVNQCRIMTWCFGVKINAFVLMSNHYHLLCTTPEKNLDEAICFFQSNISREISNLTYTQRFRFATRYKWSLIREANHYSNVFRYIYQNPLRAEICDSVSNYKYSTLSGLVGNEALGCPIYPQELFSEVHPSDPFELLEFVNFKLPEILLEQARKGVRRTLFKPPEEKRCKRVGGDGKKSLGAF